VERLDTWLAPDGAFPGEPEEDEAEEVGEEEVEAESGAGGDAEEPGGRDELDPRTYGRQPPGEGPGGDLASGRPSRSPPGSLA
jgi:hypothetical protein